MSYKKLTSDVYKHPDVIGAGEKKRQGLSPKDYTHAVMREFYKGHLRSGSGAPVTSKAQALKIALRKQNCGIKRLK